MSRSDIIPIDSGVRQWSNPLMIALHYVWAKLNNRMCAQFESDMTWYCFCFDFVCSYELCSCTAGLKLDAQGQGGGEISAVDGQGCLGSWKLDNFHGRHMCIVPNLQIFITGERMFPITQNWLVKSVSLIIHQYWINQG